MSRTPPELLDPRSVDADVLVREEPDKKTKRTAANRTTTTKRTKRRMTAIPSDNDLICGREGMRREHFVEVVEGGV
jgi:hypothetical protein